MYLHIGNGESIKTDDVIGIFDLDTATVSKVTKKYISKKEKCQRNNRFLYEINKKIAPC